MKQQTNKSNEGSTVGQNVPQKPFDMKMAAVILLGLVAIILAYYIFGLSGQVMPGTESLRYDTGELSNSSGFVSDVQAAKKIYIVMDLRNVASDKQKNNIMQCGTDFAGSQGLVGKELSVLAIESNTCTLLNGTSDINGCIKEAMTGVGFFINSGNSTTFFKNKIIIGIGEVYQPKSCGVNVKAG